MLNFWEWKLNHCNVSKLRHGSENMDLIIILSNGTGEISFRTLKIIKHHLSYIVKNKLAWV